jgi:hypothetical protein
MINQVIYSPFNGKPIPVNVDLKLLTLKYEGKEVKIQGENALNNRWVYVKTSVGLVSINVNRSCYCEKKYLENVSIMESIGYKDVTKGLQKFISEVSSNLVFEKDGVTYRVYLKNYRNKFHLDCVKPFWLNMHSHNIHIDKVPNRYKDVCFLPEDAYSKWAHELKVDLKKAFGYEN